MYIGNHIVVVEKHLFAYMLLRTKLILREASIMSMSSYISTRRFEQLIVSTQIGPLNEELKCNKKGSVTMRTWIYLHNILADRRSQGQHAYIYTTYVVGMRKLHFIRQ